MGLDCSHDAWHGAYSAFMRWREKLAEVAGLPPLRLMEGFYATIGCEVEIPTLFHGAYTGKSARDGGSPRLNKLDEQLPIRWGCLKPSPLHELLHHSDCDGEIAPDRCGPIADALEALIPLLPSLDDEGHIENWRDKTAAFVAGLRAAAAANEPLRFR
jgi:hypothetical protein